MSNLYDYKKRQLIPRWYPYDFACVLGETQATNISNVPKFFINNSYEKKIQDWIKYNNLIYAIELVGTALIADDRSNNHVLEAANTILKNNKATNISKELANKIFEKKDIVAANLDNQYLANKETAIAKRIAKLKKERIDYLYNAITWVDLAFYYSSLGQNQKADKAMGIALYLSMENRFVLRSASRFYVHLDDPEKSLYYLKKTSLTRSDPWLTASEIAISDIIDKSIRRIKQARSFLDNKDISPLDKAELASALSTIEYSNGNIRKSKKLLELSLIRPNENTVAQAQWLSKRINMEINISNYKIPALFEAKTRSSFAAGLYEDSINFSKQWLRFQPYTSTPAIHGSYTAAVALQNDDLAIDIIKEALPASPRSFLLLNNYAFSLASKDNIHEAEKVLSQISKSTLTEREIATLTATEGLIAFRKGLHKEGREKYSDAVKKFKRIDELSCVLLARLFWAREETKIGSDIYENITKIVKLNAIVNMPEVVKYIEHLKK